MYIYDKSWGLINQSPNRELMGYPGGVFFTVVVAILEFW
jgi:hypothetical protein